MSYYPPQPPPYPPLPPQRFNGPPPRRQSAAPWIFSIFVALVVGYVLGAVSGRADAETGAGSESTRTTVAVAPADRAESASSEPAPAPPRPANSVPGEGIYLVGKDVPAGSYVTAGPSGIFSCYYKFVTGTGADASIIDDERVRGQSRVTLVDGDVFATEDCLAWVLSE